MPTGARFVFEPFELDPARRRLTARANRWRFPTGSSTSCSCSSRRPATSSRRTTCSRPAGRTSPSGDNSLEQAISSLRRLLGSQARARVIETVPRRGYRFAQRSSERPRAKATPGSRRCSRRIARSSKGGRRSKPSRANRCLRARLVFDDVAAQRAGVRVRAHRPGQRLRHAVRDDARRPRARHRRAGARRRATRARRAGSIRSLAKRGPRWDSCSTARATASTRARRRAAPSLLEPDNWRHHFRLAFVSWGEERLRAAHRTLALAPGFSARALAGGHRARGTSGAGRGRTRAEPAAIPCRRRQADRASAPSPCTGCSDSFSFASATKIGPWRNSSTSCARRRRSSVRAGVLRQHLVCDRGASSPPGTPPTRGPLSGTRSNVSPHTRWRASAWLPPRDRRGPFPQARRANRLDRPASVERPCCKRAHLALAGAHAEAAAVVDEAIAAAPTRQRRLAPSDRAAAARGVHTRDAWSGPLARLRNRAV